jgi:hypothetical protein
MKLIILGDIHGHWDGANATVHSALNEHPDAKAVVSLGDLGDGWPIRGGFNRWKPDFDLPIYVVDGNHENFDAIEAGNINPKLRWTGRGTTLDLDGNMVMFFGGATSPDRDGRVIGKSWWPQESITREQVEYALQYQGPRLTAMFCHERAECFPIPKDKQPVIWANQCGRSDRIALETVVRKYRPEFYFHGHWHWGHMSSHNVRHSGMDVDTYIRVVACPVINEQETVWTVFDGYRIWKNWS